MGEAQTPAWSLARVALPGEGTLVPAKRNRWGVLAQRDFRLNGAVRRVTDGAQTELFDACVRREFEPLIREAAKG